MYDRIALTVIVLLPILAFVFLEATDYTTTIQAYHLGATEANPIAAKLLKENRLEDLLYLKAVHLLAVILVYIMGLVIMDVGYKIDNDALKLTGLTLILLFAVTFTVGLLVVFLNNQAILSMIHLYR